MEADELRQVIELGKEGRSLEFKQSMPWSDADFKAKIAKSILAFSNVRDGGRIVIGVQQSDDHSFDPVGVEDGHVTTWNYDDVKSYVSEFADPFVEFDLERVSMDAKRFIVITIAVFSELPVVCKKGGAAKLRRGAIYTRTYRKPESAEVPSQTELREILDLAIEKRLRAFLTTASHAGLGMLAGPSDSERFDHELGDML